MELMPLAPFDGDQVLQLDAAKRFLRVRSNDEDTTIADLRNAAVQWIERYTRLGLSRRSWRWSTHCGLDRLRPSFGPITTVTNVTIIDHAGASLPVEIGGWSCAMGLVELTTSLPWRSARRIEVTFDAGFEDAAKEAPALMSAVRLLLLHLWDGGNADDVPGAVTMLCAPFRMPVLA